MKKKLLSVVLAATMVFSLVACGSSESNSSAEGASSESAATTTDASGDVAPAGDGAVTGTLKLGLIGPLTGGAALYGTACANAAQLAVDESRKIIADSIGCESRCIYFTS